MNLSGRCRSAGSYFDSLEQYRETVDIRAVEFIENSYSLIFTNSVIKRINNTHINNNVNSDIQNKRNNQNNNNINNNINGNDDRNNNNNDNGNEINIIDNNDNNNDNSVTVLDHFETIEKKSQNSYRSKS